MGILYSLSSWFAGVVLQISSWQYWLAFSIMGMVAFGYQYLAPRLTTLSNM